MIALLAAVIFSILAGMIGGVYYVCHAVIHRRSSAEIARSRLDIIGSAALTAYNALALIVGIALVGALSLTLAAHYAPH